MSEAIRRAPPPRPRIPLWDDYGQAERFAGVVGLATLFAGATYLFAERMLVMEICVGLAAALFALCTWSARGGPIWVLGIGTPLALTIGALALLLVTAGTCVASAGLLAVVPAVAVLWSGSEKLSWAFLGATFGSTAALAFLAPDHVLHGAEPWIADPRTPWLIAPLASALFLLARSWQAAHSEWQQEVLAAHAVVAASEARFKAYIENAHDVTAELDARGRLLFITTRNQARFPRPVAELLGSEGSQYIHPDDLATARSAFEAAAAGRATVSEPLRYRGTHEGWRYLRVAVSSYRTHAGKLRFVLQARDETSVVEAQRAREQRVSELEAALARVVPPLAPVPPAAAELAPAK